MDSPVQGADAGQTGRPAYQVATRALRPALAALLVATLPVAGRGQDPGEALRSVTPENAALYLAPLARGMSRALSTGLAPTLRTRGAFDLSLGVRFVGATVVDEDLTYPAVLPASVLYRGTLHESPFGPAGGAAPTVAGPATAGQSAPPRTGSTFEAALRAAGEDPRDFALELPGGAGLDRPWAPLLEATLGLGLGTDLVARFAPTFTWDHALGDADVFGVALLHSLDRWLGLTGSPLELRLTGSLQRLRAGSYLETLATSAGLVVGWATGPLDLYAHGRFEDLRSRTRQRIHNPAGNPALPPDASVVEHEVGYPAASRVGLGAILHTPLLTLDAELSPGGGGALAARVTLQLPPPRGARP